jgi:hypothetical protein
VVLVLDILFLRWYLMSQNNKKTGDPALPEQDVVQAFGDFTDRENKSFRYVL